MPGDCTDIRGIFSAIFWPWKSLQVHATSNSNQSVDCLANYPSPVSRCKLSQPRRPHSSISSSRFLSNSLQLRPAVWMMAFTSASVVSGVTKQTWKTTVASLVSVQLSIYRHLPAMSGTLQHFFISIQSYYRRLWKTHIQVGLGKINIW